MWKGTPERTIGITTCGGVVDGVGLSCGETAKFALGSRYVVFAKGEPLTAASICDGTDSVECAGRTLEWLSDKPYTKAR